MLLPLLAALGLNAVFDLKWNKQTKKYLLIALAGTAGLCLFLIAIPDVFEFKKSIESQLPPWLSSAMVQDRKGILQADAFRSLIFISLAGLMIFLYWKGKISALLGSGIMIALILLDLWFVDRRYLNDDNYKRKTRNSGFVASDADKRIQQDNDLHYRVLNLFGTWNEANTSYFHASIGGYHGAKMRRYQELIERCLDDQKNEVITKLQSGSRNFSELNVLNMLNMKYVKFGDKADQVLQNPFANGNAWVADSIVTVRNANEEIDQTCAVRVPGVVIIDESNFEVTNKNSANGIVQLTSYKPNMMEYDAVLDKNGIVVFSEIYYPKGWKAYIDGNETPILRANYVLRAIEVPEGSHNITFEFKPKAYHVGNAVMLATSLLLMLLILFGVYDITRKQANA